MSASFTVTKHEFGHGVARLAVSGEVETSTSDALSVIIVNALTAAGLTDLIVDLDRVNFLDSTGASALLAGHTAAVRQGITYRVINAHEQVRRVLAATGVLDIRPGDGEPT